MKSLHLILATLTIATLLNIYLYNTTETNLTQQTHQLLINDTQTKLQQINNYITNLTNEITTLQNSEQIRTALKQNTASQTLTNYTNLILTSSTGQITYSQELTTYQPPQNKNITITGPYQENYGELYPKISITAPIYENQTHLGYITITTEMKTIFQITKNTTNLKTTGQSYLINHNKTLLTPLRNYEFNILTQEIKTATANTCTQHQETIHENELQHIQEKVTTYENYKGEQVLGMHDHIQNTNWCIVNEINENETITTPLKKTLTQNIIITTTILLTLIILITPLHKPISKTKINQTTLAKTITLTLIAITTLYIIKNQTSLLTTSTEIISIAAFTYIIFYTSKKPNTKAKTYILTASTIAAAAQTAQIILTNQTINNITQFSISMIPISIINLASLLLFMLGFKETK